MASISFGRLLSLLVALVLSGFIPLTGGQSARAQESSAPRTVWVENAGHSIDGLFLDEWRNDPEMLGLPISEEFQTSVISDRQQPVKRTVQYFQNMALVYVPGDDRPGYQVQALPLGRDALARDQSSLKQFKLPAKGSCQKLSADECIISSETGHSMRLGFKAFWEANDGARLIGRPISEEFVGPDGVTIQYYENAVLLWQSTAGVKLRPIGKDAAKIAKVPTQKLSNPNSLPVYDESLFVPPIQEVDPLPAVGSTGSGPGPQQGANKEIVVSISAQTMWAYEGSEEVISTLVSTGVGDVPETVTPLGYYSVLTKYDSQTMEGTISEEYYKVEDVPFVMYFDDLGNAIHGTYWHSNFGSPMSHGCVNLPLDVAAFIYAWAPEGTAVSIIS